MGEDKQYTPPFSTADRDHCVVLAGNEAQQSMATA
jgi:hypothetical protein